MVHRRAPVPPLPLANAGPFKGRVQPIWIDTDAACGVAMDVYVDDCFDPAICFILQRTR